MTKDIIIFSQFLTALLCLSYFFSLFARYSWFFDLFSHFMIQYAVGGLILFLIQWNMKENMFSAMSLAIACLCIFEIIVQANFSSESKARAANFTIVSYNRRYTLSDHDNFNEWVRENSKKFDMVAILEARDSHAQVAEKLRGIYPHQVYEPRTNAFGMVLMSKHPFIRERVIPLERYALDNFIINVVVQVPGAVPVSVYAVHPPPPTSDLLQKQRNSDMLTTGEYVRKDDSRAVIMVGDWNITPWSPYFSDLMRVSGLKDEVTGFIPVLSWPSHFMLPLLQIPIDHILSKGSLALIQKERGPALDSDHYPLIASFALEKSN